MKYKSIILLSLFATSTAEPRRLRKGLVRRAEGEEPPAPKEAEYIEVGAEAEDVVIKAKSLKSMSMEGGAGRIVDAKAGE
jgi:hypothetical protein